MTPFYSVPHQPSRPLNRLASARRLPAAKGGIPAHVTIPQRLHQFAEKLWSTFRERNRIRRDEAYLASMPPHQLRDIGLARLENGKFGRDTSGDR
jgi:uncharacterized protein YjiS (DUF1127 family)